MDGLPGDGGSTIDSDQRAGSAENSTAGRLIALRASAKGWHGVQLAVLGFIGLCGVLQGAAGKAGPHWLQVLAGVLVLIALGLACTATALVATAAWPVHELEEGVSAGASVEDLLHHTARRLRIGIMITFVAVVILALGATSAWWPTDESSDSGASLVEVTTNQGAACGTLQDGAPGTVTISSGGRQVVVPAGAVVRLRPVTACA
jgi:hypothetical protein